jgi:predicted metal-binding membrane protein
MRGAADATRLRERLVVGTSLALVCALAWWLTVWHAHAMHTAAPSADAGRIAGMFLMWLIMMVAMMLPAVFPVVDVFAAISRQRQGNAAYAPISFFVAGYLMVWSAFSAFATAAHWGLEHSGLIDAMMRSTSDLLTGALFFAAGLYQWTPLKQACLARCRSPIGFMLAEWREGSGGALAMGMRHGAFCVGCCAVLMTLLFAVAVMNVLWLAALTALVMVEKLLPGENFWRQAIGAALTLAGAAWMLRALLA